MSTCRILQHARADSSSRADRSDEDNEGNGSSSDEADVVDSVGVQSEDDAPWSEEDDDLAPWSGTRTEEEAYEAYDADVDPSRPGSMSCNEAYDADLAAEKASECDLTSDNDGDVGLLSSPSSRDPFTELSPARHQNTRVDNDGGQKRQAAAAEGGGGGKKSKTGTKSTSVLMKVTVGIHKITTHAGIQYERKAGSSQFELDISHLMVTQVGGQDATVAALREAIGTSCPAGVHVARECTLILRANESVKTLDVDNQTPKSEGTLLKNTVLGAAACSRRAGSKTTVHVCISECGAPPAAAAAHKARALVLELSEGETVSENMTKANNAGIKASALSAHSGGGAGGAGRILTFQSDMMLVGSILFDNQQLKQYKICGPNLRDTACVLVVYAICEPTPPDRMDVDWNIISCTQLY